MAKKVTRPSKPSAKSTTAPAPGTPPTWLVWIPPILAFVLFSTGLRNELLGIDDHTATVDNPAVTGATSIFGHFNLGMYAPITWLGYAIAYFMGKDNPFPYHLFSLLLHVFNVWLVHRLVQRISGRPRGLGAAFWVALLFAIHPVQVESVAWIAGLSTPLYALFFLLACLWYLDYAEGRGDKRRAYGLALLAFVLACLSKSAAVTLPLVLVLLDWWAKRPLLDGRRLLGYAPFFIVAAFFGALTIYSRLQSGMNMDPNATNFSVLDRLLILAYTPVFYWYNILIPLKLNIYYSFHKINGQFPWQYWVAPVVLLGTLFLAWRYRQNASFVWFGLLFFFANLSVMLPFRSMGTFDLCADHYNYLAIIGILFLLVQGVQALIERFPNYAGALRGVSALWLIALAFLCISQIRVWKNTITVVTHAIDNGYHQNGRLYLARANAYGKLLGDKDREKAKAAMIASIKDYTKALEINPELWEAYKYRGGLYGMGKDYQSSVEDLSKYLEKYPDDVEQQYNRGLSLLNLGHQAESIKAFDHTLRLNPNFLRAYRARSNAYAALGDSTRANADLREFEQRQSQQGAVR